MSVALGFAGLVAVTVAIWWRNHDILSDLYDYSSIIAGAGKIEAGLKPYVDFRSTMQSSTYFLNRAVELVAGRSYLGLTGGGLMVSLVGVVAMFALWRRSFGILGGFLLTGALVWSGLCQHVIVFYNTLGILCLAIQLAGIAERPRFTGRWTWDRYLVIGALVLGGMTKLNFQALGLALAGLLVVEAHWSRRISRRDMALSLLVLFIAGVVAPWLIELTWTGATPVQWYENVVLLADERLGFWRYLAKPSVYLGPAHDLYHHLPFKRLTAVGLALVAAVAGLAWQRVRSNGAPARERVARNMVVATYFVAAAFGGVLLTITNVETLALTSLGFVIAAAALWVAAVKPTADAGDRAMPMAWLLPAAAAFWAVNGGVAAWNGSRVLFGREEDDRHVFVRLHDAPAALRYLEGVRLDANLHASLLLVARELDRMTQQRRNLSGVLFGPTFEWMERSYPESIRPGLPVWYHVGTALRRDDGEWLRSLIERHHVDRILAHPAWESWPADFQAHLAAAYRPVPLGTHARMLERVGSEVHIEAAGSFNLKEPLAMIERTHSNLHLLGSPVPANFDYLPSPWGDCLGQSGGWEWDWCPGMSIVEGQILARRSGDASQPAPFVVTVNSLDGKNAGEELWRLAAAVPAGEEWIRLPFRITPYGRSVRVRVVPAAGERQPLFFGCREVQVRQTVCLSNEPPPSTTVPVMGQSQRLVDGTVGWLRAAAGDAHSWQTTPLENWKERATGSSPWRVTLETEPAAGPEATPPVVMLLWYRSGRIELLTQKAIERSDSGEISFEGWMPEPGGWLGVAVRPLERGKPFNLKIRVKGWEYPPTVASLN